MPSNQTMALIAGAIGLLCLPLVFKLFKSKRSVGKALSLKTFVGLFLGKPEAWQDFVELTNQPPPPDKLDTTQIAQMRALVKEELKAERKA